MNRLILIGNGFDLAHGLSTKYEDFINWYLEQRINTVLAKKDTRKEQVLCSLKIQNVDDVHRALLADDTATQKDIFNFIDQNKDLISITYNSDFFKRICNGIENKGWVDIEYDYYALLKEYLPENDNKTIKKVNALNNDLAFLREKLIEYLGTLNDKITSNIVIPDLKKNIYAPIQVNDIEIANRDKISDHIDYWKNANYDDWDRKLKCYQYDGENFYPDSLKCSTVQQLLSEDTEERNMCLLPDQIMFLNFNYTDTAKHYLKESDLFFENHIHGELKKPGSVIFGYGDELDEYYKEMQNKNENEYLTNVKSIKYLESDNYRRLLSFIESAPFQVFVMGHSCGLSDRTLLNTIFEHKNCVSIKPFYHKKEDNTDNYLEIVQNISRNFNDMKLMRDRVVSKPYCETI